MSPIWLIAGLGLVMMYLMIVPPPPLRDADPDNKNDGNDT